MSLSSPQAVRRPQWERLFFWLVFTLTAAGGLYTYLVNYYFIDYAPPSEDANLIAPRLAPVGQIRYQSQEPKPPESAPSTPIESAPQIASDPETNASASAEPVAPAEASASVLNDSEVMTDDSVAPPPISTPDAPATTAVEPALAEDRAENNSIPASEVQSAPPAAPSAPQPTDNRYGYPYRYYPPYQGWRYGAPQPYQPQEPTQRPEQPPRYYPYPVDPHQGWRRESAR